MMSPASTGMSKTSEYGETQLKPSTNETTQTMVPIQLKQIPAPVTFAAPTRFLMPVTGSMNRAFKIKNGGTTLYQTKQLAEDT